MKWCHDHNLDLKEEIRENVLGIQCQCIKMTSKELWPSSITLTKLLMLIPTVQKPVFPKRRLLTFHLEQRAILSEIDLWIL